MLIELYVFYEVVVLGIFLLSFFTKQEILWAITAVLSGILMFSSYDIQVSSYEFNTTISAYSPIVVSYHPVYLVYINMIFFSLALLLGLFDMFDKYGGKLFNKNKDDDDEE